MITIRSNGTPQDTEVYMDGQMVRTISEINLKVGLDELNEVILKLHCTEKHLSKKEENIGPDGYRLFIEFTTLQTSRVLIDGNKHAGIYNLRFKATHEKIECSFDEYFSDPASKGTTVIF